MSSNEKRRKWILSLGFSEAEADSFIQFEVPKRKIEALAEVLYPKPEPEPAVSEPPAEGDGFGDYACPQCKVTHRAGSKIHKRHLKLLKG